MIRKYKNHLLVMLFIGLSACSDQWEEHNGAAQDLNNNLVQLIRSDADLSTFADLLEESGLDKQLASGSYTVWAPTNAALEGLPATITGDQASLKLFVGNHIGYQENLSYQAADAPVRVKMINGKVSVLEENSITSVDESASFESADRLAKNGVLYKVDAYMLPKKNIWEIVKEESDNPVSQLILSMSVTDELTMETYNYFQYDVADLSNEDSTYTFIMLDEAAYGSFQTEMEPYFKDTLPDEMSIPLSLGLTKDLVFTTAYYDNVPDTILSVDSVKVAFNADNVVRQINASNGVVYVMNDFDYKLSDKIPEIKIEGEYYDAISGSSGPVNVRARSWASNKRDLLVYNHSTPSYHVTYDVPQAHSTKYQIYWVANNDDYWPRNNWQSIAIDSVSNLPYGNKMVEFNNLEEVFIGEHEVQNYGQLKLILKAESTSNNDWNTLVLDYLKLVPVFE
ncbi:fasciclin domain-containing protein [Echinicola sp. CAU 1574]|uniref:Fasciclin domain-containing protein n=1 Tax=Echinicola arenosa TaxID=2774144 RepID=A0ABR9ALU0_9BACT|nr:fasciclin domain-containing protein [Echinicola arenosa]MBD8489779.1 fasciclin domain-containing protein [Echinicola arenosa]